MAATGMCPVCGETFTAREAGRSYVLRKMTPRVRRAIAAVAAVIVAVALAACGETASSYCHGLYDGPDGGTPKWAAKDDLFSDYASCVDWYGYVRGQADQ